MAIRYEIDVPLRTNDGTQISPSLLEVTRDELAGEFGEVHSFSIYRVHSGASVDPDQHEECVRFWFDAREVPDTHTWIVRWRHAVASKRFPATDLVPVWCHPVE